MREERDSRGWVDGWVSRGVGCECDGNTDADDALNWGCCDSVITCMCTATGRCGMSLSRCRRMKR